MGFTLTGESKTHYSHKELQSFDKFLEKSVKWLQIFSITLLSFFSLIVIVFLVFSSIFNNANPVRSEITAWDITYLPRHSWQYSLSSHSASPRDWKIYTTIHDSASNIPYCNFLLTGLTHFLIFIDGAISESQFWINNSIYISFGKVAWVYQKYVPTKVTTRRFSVLVKKF